MELDGRSTLWDFKIRHQLRNHFVDEWRVELCTLPRHLRVFVSRTLKNYFASLEVTVDRRLLLVVSVLMIGSKLLLKSEGLFHLKFETRMYVTLLFKLYSNNGLSCFNYLGRDVRSLTKCIVQGTRLRPNFIHGRMVPLRENVNTEHVNSDHISAITNCWHPCGNRWLVLVRIETITKGGPVSFESALCKVSQGRLVNRTSVDWQPRQVNKGEIKRTAVC